MQRPRVLIADRREVMVRALELLFTAQGFHVTACVTSEVEALNVLDRRTLDVAAVSLDFSATPADSVRLLLQRTPDLKVLMYSERPGWPLQELLDAGVRGCVLTTVMLTEFLEAVRLVASGCSYLDSSLTTASPTIGDPLAGLSKRERQIIGLLAHGLTGSEVAARLFLSPTTVRTHIQNALHKLGAHTRAHAIAIASGLADAQRPAA